MTTFTIIALLAISLTLLAWIACLLRHDAKQESFINHLVSRIIEREEELETSFNFQSDLQADIADLQQKNEDKIFRIKEVTNSWIESLQQEILDLETAVRDANNELYVRKAEVEQLQWNLSTYESVCNPNTEVEDELAIARRCIWDKEHQLSSLKFQVSLVKEVLLGLETKIGKEEPNLFEISSDLRWAIASISHDEIPF